MLSHLQNAEPEQVSSIQALAWLNPIVDDSGDESEGENVVQEENWRCFFEKKFYASARQ